MAIHHLLVQEGERIPEDYLPANLDARGVSLHDEACEGFAGWSPGIRISAGKQEVPGEDRDGDSVHPQQSDTSEWLCQYLCCTGNQVLR